MPVPRDRSTIEEIDQLVKRTYTGTEVTKHVNKNNSDHSILFEAIKLTMRMGEYASKENIRTSILLLVKFTGVKEPNIRYIALECLSKAQPYHLETCPRILSENLNTFLSGLKESDISIRKSTVDSLFTLATSETSSEIINEFLDHLQEKNDF
jgi:AP-2 complex subunit alpha